MDRDILNTLAFGRALRYCLFCQEPHNGNVIISNLIVSIKGAAGDGHATVTLPTCGKLECRERFENTVRAGFEFGRLDKSQLECLFGKKQW